MNILLVAVTLIVIASPSLANYGSLRITDGGDSGRLEFQDADGVWGTVCGNGFGEDAGDVACRQLGYLRAEDVLRNQNYPSRGLPINICRTSCDGDEDRLRYCQLTPCGTIPSCDHSQDVGVSCTDELSAAAIVGIVLGTIFFFSFIAFMITVCFCCCLPSCPCYYRNRSYYRRTVVVTQQPQVLTYTPPSYSAATQGYSPAPPSGYPPPTNKY
ncbi:galectin-3-binding protein A-like [Dysidea avara]|uniref:galectin-3-binding protein A-like n=1 Tax=Dysidea avara TaxID=196820 RepID=UPI00332AFDA4